MFPAAGVDEADLPRAKCLEDSDRGRRRNGDFFPLVIHCVPHGLDSRAEFLGEAAARLHEDFVGNIVHIGWQENLVPKRLRFARWKPSSLMSNRIIK